MPRTIRRRPLHWGVIAGAAGALLAACVLTGCPGDIDPSIMMPSGGTGTGGSGSGTGGGSGGSSNCTGSNAGDQIITTKCATSGCHDAADVGGGGAGLDLTVNSGLAGRLVGVMSTGTGISACKNASSPYLKPNVTPVQGLLVDKVTGDATCGVRMPYIPPYLTSTQQQCLLDYLSTLVNQ
jgi:hypothetical protein